MKDEPRRYATAAAFRVALEARLKTMEQAEGIDLQRLRRQVSFDRLLARFFSEQNTPWLLKGGYAMELRLRTARTTKDIDLSLPVDVTSERKRRVLEHLQTSMARGFERLFRLYHRSAHDGSGCCTGRRCKISGNRVIGRSGFHKVSSRCRGG